MTPAARKRQFDVLTTMLIGVVALLAAIFGILQADYGMVSARAAAHAARLEADASAKLQGSALSRDASLRAVQDSLAVQMSGLGLAISGLQAGDATAQALGTAQADGGKRLQAALEATARTSGQAPVDAYTAGLINATDSAVAEQVKRQNDAVDEAADAGSRSNRAVLALSLATLGGVLAGIAAVLKVGRPGWITLGVAWALATSAAVVGLLAVL